MQLFYSEHINANIVELNKLESRHLIQVLRKNIGDQIWFTDGQGLKCLFEIQNDNPKKALLKKLDEIKISPPTEHLHIAIAPTKNMDRFEWFAEKSTEIGIQSIIPFVSENSERKVLKLDRLEKILIAAMKQSLRFYKPKMQEIKDLKSIISLPFEGQKFICHLEKENIKFLSKELKPGHDSLILVGPEGDFTSEEIELAKSNGFIPVALGEYRLRTETAAVVACQVFNQKQI